MNSSLIRDAVANAQQELAKKRSFSTHSTPHSSSSSSSSAAASKKLKTSHPFSRLSFSSAPSSSVQSIKDAIAASRSELESKRKHSFSLPSSSSPSPPPKPLSPYERFISDHWEDDEYDGLGDDEKRSALNKRFEAVSFSKKEAWTSEWQRQMEQWERDTHSWETQQGRAQSRGTEDNGESGSSRSVPNSHKPASTARTPKPATSSPTAFSPTASYSSAYQPQPSQSSAAGDFSSSPLIAHHYTQQGGQLSLVPHTNKYHKAFLTLTFPITRITALVSLLPQPLTAPSTKLFPQLTVATLSRAVDYFIQHVSALVLVAAVTSGSKVLRPEDYRAVIMRRTELWWLRWAQEEDRDVKGRYRTGQLAALEKKRRDAEDLARGRKIKSDDGEHNHEDGGNEGEGGLEESYQSDDDERRMEDEQGEDSKMDEDNENEDSNDLDVSAEQRNTDRATTADHMSREETRHTSSSSTAASFNNQTVDGDASENES